ncbi:helix-turn-helix transcriptional regulator [Streptomyces sp. APSN-46.1]|uniref:MmyB family transcriptional regulator n=1 Tax=Streptomyces sp. APSN-46.1 TaxID=2929049 RepID=UPI001FB33BA7|nr:helix-turn-helix domain-containing protein [Streptomyces sp. APSN-46.1]MCJ1676273.1 helix-turn-helix transcriptional regulator [Streptomyces sp. APSN-46.1]
MGFPKRMPGPGRRAAGLSQEQMDVLLTRTPGTYNRFENGQLANPGADLLTTVARTLRLDEQEWAFLWLITRKENPPHALHSSSGTAIAVGAWQRVVDQINGAMAFVNDAEWNVIVHNEDYRRLFPRGRTPANIMRWLLLDPEARTDVLMHWETYWAPAMMPHLKHSVELRPENPALDRLEYDVLNDPVAGPLYREHAAAPIPYFDGSELPIRHAVHGPGLVTTCLAEPVTAPGARVNLSFYTPENPLLPKPPRSDK